MVRLFLLAVRVPWRLHIKLVRLKLKYAAAIWSFWVNLQINQVKKSILGSRRICVCVWEREAAMRGSRIFSEGGSRPDSQKTV